MRDLMYYQLVDNITVLYTYIFVKRIDIMLNGLTTIFKSYIAKVSAYNKDEMCDNFCNLSEQLNEYVIWNTH